METSTPLTSSPSSPTNLAENKVPQETHEITQEIPQEIPQKTLELIKLNDWMLQQLQEQERLVVSKLRHWTRVFNDVQRKLMSAKKERNTLEELVGGEENLKKLMNVSISDTTLPSLQRLESEVNLNTLGRSTDGHVEVQPGRLVFANWPLDDSFYHIAKVVKIDTVLSDWIQVEFEFNKTKYQLTCHCTQIYDPSLLKRGDRIFIPLDRIRDKLVEKGIETVREEDDPQGHLISCILDKCPLVIPINGTIDAFQVIPLVILSGFKNEIKNMIDPDDEKKRCEIETKYWIEVGLGDIVVDYNWIEKKGGKS